MFIFLMFIVAILSSLYVGGVVYIFFHQMTNCGLALNCFGTIPNMMLVKMVVTCAVVALAWPFLVLFLMAKDKATCKRMK